MPNSVSAPLSTQGMSESLPDFREITRFCTLDEISQMLKLMEKAIVKDHERLTVWRDAHSMLLDQIDGADQADLHSIHEQLNQMEKERFLTTFSVPALHESCTHYRDLLAQRAMELVAEDLADHGKPLPVLPFALISLGSDGRLEQTLITDQDYLIVYGDDGGEAMDAYFLEYSNRLVDCLAEVGFKRCTGDIMPSNQSWRGSYAQWRKRLLAIVRYEVEDLGKNMMDLIVLSDARYVAGDRVLAEQLISLIRSMERDYFQVLWGMARAATEMKLALGLMKRLWVETSGEHKGEFNLKLLAWAPLVMNVRILAINQGIPATNTVERITLLQQEGSFSEHVANDLREAYHVFTKHRILLQINMIKGAQKDSYYLNPYVLDYVQREQLRHAIIKVEELQKMIHTNFNIV